MARARSTTAASCILQAYLDPELVELTLSAEFAELRPLSSATQFSAVHLAQPHVGRLQHGQRVFERAAARLLELGPRAAVLPQSELLRVHACIALMYGAVMGGVDVADGYVELYLDATRRGMLDNAHLRLQLAALGSWVGRCAAHVDWLMDAKSRSFELVDTYLLVRDDASDALLERTAAAVRGERIDPTSCLSPRDPATTLTAALKYAAGCMRDPSHLCTEGHGLAVLTIIEDVQRHRAGLTRRKLLRPEVRRFDETLRRLSTVQYMEKQRFLNLLDALPPGAVKERFVELWERDVVVDRITRGAALRWAEDDGLSAPSGTS